MTNVQYITDAEGHKTAVILPIEDYEEMLEDLHFGEVARESKDEPKRNFTEVLEEMRESGEMDV
jgi:PHD/YefM family antitoxin component YafN of YafNO toxin-antitoxin module